MNTFEKMHKSKDFFAQKKYNPKYYSRVATNKLLMSMNIKDDDITHYCKKSVENWTKDTEHRQIKLTVVEKILGNSNLRKKANVDIL